MADEYKCPECSLIFTSGRGLGIHRSNKHNYHAPKYKSRATRASEQASLWRDIADKLEELSQETFVKVEDAQNILDELSISELESLMEEMTSWRDNMEERLSNTPKYEEVSAACEELESIDLSGIETISDTDEIDNIVEELRSAADILEGVSFPGMY